jgi:hypothetical protein
VQWGGHGRPTGAPRRHAKPHASHFIFRCQFGDLIACRTSKAQHRIMVFTCGNERPAASRHCRPRISRAGGRRAHNKRQRALRSIRMGAADYTQLPFHYIVTYLAKYKLLRPLSQHKCSWPRTKISHPHKGSRI